MKRTITVLAGGMFLAAAAACGGSTAASHPAHADPRNTRVCEHYRTQRNYVRSVAAPTLADVTKVLGWIAADEAQVTPGTPLARDLAGMLGAMQGKGNTYATSRQVLRDCQALGVTF